MKKNSFLIYKKKEIHICIYTCIHKYIHIYIYVYVYICNIYMYFMQFIHICKNTFLIYFSRCNAGISHKICILCMYQICNKYDIFAQKPVSKANTYQNMLHILCIFHAYFMHITLKYATQSIYE